MSNDGQQDFYTITNLRPAPQFPDQISVVHNSILASTMILQAGLNFSSFSWRRLLWDYIDNVRSFLDGGDESYMLSFVEIADAFKDEVLCKPSA